MVTIRVKGMAIKPVPLNLKSAKEHSREIQWVQSEMRKHKFRCRTSVASEALTQVLPVFLVQSLIFASNPKKLPCLVHISAAVPFMTSISIEMIAIVTFFASTSNIMPFRLIHLRLVESPVNTRAHAGA